jgi:hypothetical protein
MRLILSSSSRFRPLSPSSSIPAGGSERSGNDQTMHHLHVGQNAYIMNGERIRSPANQLGLIDVVL